ncbi:Cholinephosphotransferase 1 isoform X3 [Oopsacas minuta]|uniref:Cholinephosphotransferase 1 isoform X3 n=1 Tax=Oopsacas minuta TaxID=111878 RepID=A0AAV7K390_9METZ|nr:Cholinephosphotransferase 1 isoform X3 [Oopsacas minuta]
MSDGYFLSQQQLKRLGNYNYKSVGSTLLDYVLQPFWNWLVRQMPMWLAPNLITFIGLVINIATGIILMTQNPDLHSDAPRWSYVLFAIGLFVYTNLDAIDGKQARRTGSASPLGELFDHGCDSVSCIFLVLATLSAFQFGGYQWFTFWHIFTVTLLFYSYQWRTYVNGTLTFNLFDVTEAQYFVIGTCILRGIIGPRMLDIEVYPNLSLLIVIHYLITAVEVYILLRTLLPITHEGVGKNGTTEAGTSVLSPGIPVIIIIVFSFLYARHSRIYPLVNYPALFGIAFSLPVSKYSILAVLAHMTKSPLPLLDSVMLGPLFALVNIYFGSLLDELVVLWFCLLYVCLNTLLASILICFDICNHLDIYCFRIKPVKT